MHRHTNTKGERETTNGKHDLILIYAADFARITRITYLHLERIDILFTSQIMDDLPGNI